MNENDQIQALEAALNRAIFEIENYPQSPNDNIIEGVRAAAITEMLNFMRRVKWNASKIYQSEEDFRQGWKDAMTGKTHPIESLWDDVMPPEKESER